jgi:hypothetical protein
MSAPTVHPFKANPSDFLMGVTFTDRNGKSQPGDPHGCITGPAAQALTMHLGTIGLTATVAKDFSEHGWPKDAPFTQSAQVPFLDIKMATGQVIHVNAATIHELYDGRYSPQLADYIVQQRCLRVAG